MRYYLLLLSMLLASFILYKWQPFKRRVSLWIKIKLLWLAHCLFLYLWWLTRKDRRESHDNFYVFGKRGARLYAENGVYHRYHWVDMNYKQFEFRLRQSLGHLTIGVARWNLTIKL